MKSKLLPFFLLVFANALSAQVTLRGTLANMPLNSTRQLALEGWNAERWQAIQVVYLDPDNSFSVRLEAPGAGQYRLRAWGEAKMWNDFILSADSLLTDTLLVFNLDYQRLNTGPAKITGSLANTLYYDLLQAYAKAHPATPDNTPAAVKRLHALQTDLNRRCMELANKYRKTLIGDIALLMYEPVQADYGAAVQKMSASEFAQAHALDQIPFHHDNVLYHNGFLKRLNRYFDYFERTPAGNKAYVDGVMSRRNGNDYVDGFLFKHLLEKLMDFRQEEGLNYLLHWYAPDCTDESPLPDGTLNLIEALKVCAPGNIAPDISLKRPDGQPSTLSEVCAKQKLTLMLFWRTTCSHCREFEPELEKLYAKYHPLGLEVYALSTDPEKTDWLEELQQHPRPWINVYIPPDLRRDVSRNFPAPSTPTLIALDKDRRVLSRVMARANLEAFLKEKLN
ncbi:MAG TPA: TlpA disulfide reductase family protein [Saprospiraceae bacterium]|nr:TlpA disulfide reductase family protein [Saprospiraceae bacterium]